MNAHFLLRLRPLVFLGFSSLLSETSFAQSSPGPEPPLVLPRLTIRAERLDPGWLIPPRDLTPPDLRGVPPEVIFPHQARFESVYDGRAVVGIMLDAAGNPTDFLLLKYTKPYFGEELLQVLRTEKFTPRRVKGVPVPGRIAIHHRFDVDAGSTLPLNVMEAAAERTNRLLNSGHDGPPFIYEPHLEHEIDGGELRFTNVTTPILPPDSALPAERKLKIVVSFYVDEQGQLRLPNVDSNSPPSLTPAVIEAMSQWKFIPPLLKGKPALVFAMRSLILEAAPPRTP